MEKIEKLAPPLWLENLINWQHNLGQLIEAEKKINEQEETDKHIRIDQTKSGVQYYLIEKKGQKIGNYITKVNIHLVKKLVQHKYNVKIFPELQKQYKIIDKFLENYAKVNLEKYYESLSTARKKLVEPITLSNSLYIKRWCQNKQQEQSRQIFMPEGKIYATKNGDTVRSKSEMIIADALSNYNIPYFYELPLKVGKTLYPDFTCLNVRTRTEYIWEHLGLMDDFEYVSKNINKMIIYENYGFFPGKNIIITMETSKLPLTLQRVEKVIKEYLL